MTSLKDIRSEFLSFFEKNDHKVMPSSPLVPDNDPSLLFVNAGMVQFKNVFTGAEKRPAPSATTSQKCVRAGGKHNDLDNVGYTARHHTFFEMLGNFSFGDYFKEDAIKFGWDLVTGEFGLDPEKLLVTIYHTDDEAFDIWKKITGFHDSKIIRIPTSDNFWSMGDTGPCGPCSEIFYDHGPDIWGGPPGSPEEDGDRFIEIWNLVFMQFEKHADGSVTDLPKPSIDTGMGLERMAAIAQGVHDNYDVDLFKALIAASVDQTGVQASGEAKFSHRVIADHLRSTSFLIADGVGPSNEGRGYVLRRIMRRAMRHAHILGAKDPLMHRLVPALVTEMGEAYPELKRAQPVIEETLRQEEERFRRTLGRGESLLEEATAGLKEGDKLPGDVAFKLYDTFGFPIDLTQDALRSKGLEVDMDGYDAAMDEQKAKSKEGKFSTGDAATDELWFDIRDNLGATTFTGYGNTEDEGRVLAIIRNGERVDEAAEGDLVQLVFDQTPFYAESGGQAGDLGRVEVREALVEIEDVQKQAGDLHVLIGTVKKGFFKVGEVAQQYVDAKNRERTKRNHSATHLLHSALRNILGPHVAQKGQMVDGERIRFDFAHGAALNREEIDRIERQVNDVILANDTAETKEMEPEAAIEAGAIALFGEKYGDRVRVLSLGQSRGEDAKAYSVELCGGTHVHSTGDIGIFKIINESAVAAGVRRVEALTGEAARDWYEAQTRIAHDIAGSLKVPPAQLAERVETLSEERKRLEKELAEAKKQLALAGGGQGGGDAVEEIGGHKFMGRVLHGVGGRDLRGLIDEGKAKLKSGIVAYVGVADGKGAIAVGVTDDLKDKISAVDLVRAGAAAMGGKGGGGRPDMAQAGGPDADKADNAIAAIKAALG